MKNVEYDSCINELNFGIFKEKELDIFFSICYKMKNKGLDDIVLSFQELKELSNYKNRNLERFVKDLDSLYTKMLNVKIEIREQKGVRTKFTLFTKYTINEITKEILIKINSEYSYILNNITKYTKFDLMEFVELKSTYSKNMFKILKQYESNNQNEKWLKIKIDDFRELLGVPKSYQMSKIDDKVLKPILEQLKPMFTGLKIEKIKKGVKVDSLKFTWKKKKESKKKLEQIEGIKIKKGLGEKELLEFQEAEKENNNIKKIDNIETDHQHKEKIKISKEDYEKLYKEHLKEHGIVSSKAVRIGFDKSNISKYEIIEKLEDIQQEREETTGEKKKIKIDDIGKIYEEFLKKYNSSDSPVMKKVFGDLVEKDYIIDLED